jgi:MraZ protein
MNQSVTLTMFIGEFRHALDEKGRIQVPVKWRPRLAEGAVVTKGFDGSLTFYPLSVWQEIAAKLAALPQSQPAARAFVRQTLAGAVDVELDKLGRILLPTYLRQYAELQKQVVLAGLYDRVELWSEARWEQYQGGIDSNSPDIAATLQSMGM